MKKAELRTKRKKEKIIQIALELFCQKGYSSISVEEIAAEAKVSKVSIFTYFESKEGLLATCLFESMKQLSIEATKVLDSSLPYREKLLAAFNLCQTQSSKQASQLLEAEINHRNKHAELIRTKIEKQKLAIYETYIDYGFAHKQINPNLTKSAIIALLSAINTDPLMSEELLPQIIHILFDGLLLD